MVKLDMLIKKNKVKDYAFVYGVNGHELKFSEIDAYDFGKFLMTKKYLNYQVKFGDNCYKNDYGFLSQFEERIKDLEPNSRLLFYFSGHGVFEGDPKQFSFEIGRDEFCSFNSLIKSIKKSEGALQEILFIFDCCHAHVIKHEIEHLNIIDSNKARITGVDYQKRYHILLPTNYIKTETYEALIDSDSSFTKNISKTIDKIAVDFLNKTGKITIKDIKDAYPNQNDLTNSPTILDSLNDDFVIGKIGERKFDKTYIGDRASQINEYLNAFSVADNVSKKWTVKVPYGPHSIIKLQGRLSKIIKEQDEEFEEFDKKAERKYFDAIQNPELALVSNAIYTFPFFMTPSRLPFWGVIPYGYHLALGILYKKGKNNIKSFSEEYFNREIVLRYKYEPSSREQKEYSAIKDYHWINELINGIIVSDVKGKIYSNSGYMYSELIPLLINSSQVDFTLEKLNEYLYVIPVSSERVNNYIYPKECLLKKHAIENIIVDYMEGRERNITPTINDITIFDLAHKKNLIEVLKRRGLEESYGLISMYHNLNIPVGIGFSLKSYKLFQDNRNLWSMLENEVREFFIEAPNNCKYNKQRKRRILSELNDIGIKINLNNH